MGRYIVLYSLYSTHSAIANPPPYIVPCRHMQVTHMAIHMVYIVHHFTMTCHPKCVASGAYRAI